MKYDTEPKGYMTFTDVNDNPELKTIKQIREYFGFTQEQFANYLHVPARTIGNWETGNRVPKPYLVELIRFKVTHDPEVLNRLYVKYKPK